MGFILVSIIAIVGYFFHAIVRLVRRNTDITFWDLLLAFVIALVPLAGLIVEGLQAADGVIDGLLLQNVMIMALVVIIASVILIIIEVFRPQRLQKSRGILGFGTGILLGVSGLIVPIVSVSFTLPPVSTPDANVNVAALGPTPTADSTQFFEIFNQVMSVIALETGLSIDQVLTALDGGQTVKQLIESNNGNVETVIDEITVIMQGFLRTLIAQGTIDRMRGAVGIAGMEAIVRYAVENDISTLQRAGREQSGVTEEPNITQEGSAFSFLTATWTPQEDEALNPVVSLTQTPVPTVTSPPTAQPTLTRTPRPTLTFTPTRELYQRPTVTVTPTLGSPCVLLMNFNVNMRVEPNGDAALIVTIPYQSAVNAFRRNPETTWWFVEYQGESGWVNAEFVTPTASCNQLPTQP
ncbi:MAG: hypothetical protein MUF87_00705 [Anaerolineae bacterium]|nr:hypothetical protein [Anaerolineae bacterium]